MDVPDESGRRGLPSAVQPWESRMSCRTVRRRLVSLAVLAAALALGGRVAAAPAEPQWLAAAQAAQPAVIASLQEMVAIESGSANAAGLAQMADYVERRLRALGASTERIAVARPQGTMVRGSLTGTGTKKMMLIAHMDTVYPAGVLATQPYRQDGNKLYGPGRAASP